MICPNCKRDNADYLRFCDACGKDLRDLALSKPIGAKDSETVTEIDSKDLQSSKKIDLNEMSQNELMIQSIHASNRTTHAIRALVRFFMVQLSFITAAFFVNFLNQLTVDEYECSRWGDKCSPSDLGSLLVVAVLVVGVVISSKLAWAELEHSNIDGVHSGKTLKF